MNIGVLFDLDGTLVDTAPDMAAALNRQLRAHHKPELPIERVRPLVSMGSTALVRLGFGTKLEPATETALVQEFLAHYADAPCVDSRVFEPLKSCLDALERYRVRWGIVTNKPGRFSEVVVRELGLHERSSCLLSGDSLAERKPHPMPLLAAATQLGLEPETCVYVGDGERDIEAGRAAGMTTVLAAYGYLPDRLEARTWGADAWVDTPAELSAWLEGWMHGHRIGL